MPKLPIFHDSSCKLSKLSKLFAKIETIEIPDLSRIIGLSGQVSGTQTVNMYSISSK